MADFLQSIPLFPVVLTIAAFQVGLWCQKKWKHPLCNPLLIAVILVIPFLLLTGFSTQVYQAGVAKFSWLLTPATVCLAVPLYEQIKVLKHQLLPILAGIVAGTLTALLSIALMCRLFSLDTAISTALLPKSITTAIGLILAEQNGGIAALTAFAIFATGLLGSVSGTVLCKVFRITDPISQGVAFGTASHVIGTSKASQLGALQGAVSSLSLAVAGILTAVLFPLFCQML